MSGLLKLMFPDPEALISDDALEWAAKLALECRRRVKEQQKRISAAEGFRNTHFSFTLLPDGIEQFVSTPELRHENSIGSDPPRPVRSGPCRPAAPMKIGLFRDEVTEGPGSGLRILNQSPPGPLKESVRCAEQNPLRPIQGTGRGS